MNRQIIHLDLDTFFVSCERLLDRKLQKFPVLIGGTSDRGVVASCSYETREYGVHSGMPMRMARLLCPPVLLLFQYELSQCHVQIFHYKIKLQN